MAEKREKYGLKFPEGTDDAQIERSMIHQGGQWTKNGKVYGDGLVEHFKRYWQLLWPEDSQTWWTELILKTILENQFTSIVGPASSWKTSTVSRIALMDWSCFTDCTTVIQSSTTLDGLKARIGGETVKLWQRAKERYDWFPGYPIDHKHCIASEDVEEEKARDIRNGIIGVACKTSSGTFVGMGAYSGRKNRRVWCVGDEFQFMELSILDAQDNLVSNGPNLIPGIIREPESPEKGQPLRGYKCVFISNTNPTRPGNPAEIVSEPDKGWGSIPDDAKTQVWKCRKLPNHPVQCVCVNLDALDSPNTPYPIDKPMWPHLAGPHKLAVYTEGSESYWSQGRGRFKFGLAAFKIITMELCNQFHAFDPIIWGNGERTKIGMLDAAYAAVGGDRCCLGWLEFGKCVDGKTRIQFYPHWVIPIIVNPSMMAEQQIAMFYKEKMESAGVPPNNFFFDGRGSLAMALAAAWSSQVNAVEFGGRPTNRVAGPNEFVIDRLTAQRRPKLAHEAFNRFVAELWWSWRYVIEADQVRGLSEDIVRDAAPREWRKVAGDRIEIETKPELKKRTGCSPDLADMAAVGIEGARRRGFQISNLANKEDQSNSLLWFTDLARDQDRINRERELVGV